MDKEKGTNHIDDKLKWHPAFLQAIKQELADYRDFLEFKYEYQLTTEPLRIDLLIVKKPKQLKLDKNIARIFRTDNLLEYKSPDISLSIKDFLKVYAYANLYAAITPNVELSDLTISFIVSKYPRNLVKYLVEVRGYKAEERVQGIYEIIGDYVPMQIIETKKLSLDENLWLKSLTNNLEIQSLNVIIKKRQHGTDWVNLDAYMDVLLRANPEVFLEVYKNMRATFEEVFTKAGIIPQWIERGIEQGIERGIERSREEIARNALMEGASLEFINKITGLDIETIRSLRT